MKQMKTKQKSVTMNNYAIGFCALIMNFRWAVIRLELIEYYYNVSIEADR